MDIIYSVLQISHVLTNAHTHTDILLHAQSTDTCNMVTTSFKERPTDSRYPQTWGAKDIPL